MKLTAIPYCGLGNRLRCLASTHRIAKLTGRDFQFCWRVLPECGAAFNDLFENAFEQVDEQWVKQAHIDKLYMDTPNPDGSVQLLDNAIARHHAGEHLVIQTCGFVAFEDEDVKNWDASKNDRQPDWFEADMRTFYQSLRPVAEVRERVEAIASQFDKHTVGVHIRRTDHAEARRVSTDENFIARMRAMLEENPKTKFFLATDCVETRSTFESIFPINLINQKYDERQARFEQATTRGSADGTRAALTDLYALSRTSVLLGRYRSTFGHSALGLNSEISLVTVNTLGDTSRTA